MAETNAYPNEASENQVSEKPHYARLPERGVIRLSGPEVQDFLQGLVTNEVAKASP